MSSRLLKASFRLTDTFDASGLVAAFKAAGWSVRRGRTKSLTGSLLDTPSGDLLSTGLAALEERSGRCATLELHLVPIKPLDPGRLLFSKTSVTLAPAREIADHVGLRPSVPLISRVSYEKETIPFNFSSKAGSLVVTLETVRSPAPRAKPLCALRLEVTKGTAATLSLAAGLVRLHDGVVAELRSGVRDLLSLLGVEAGPRLEPMPLCRKGEPVGTCAVAIIKYAFANMLAHEPGARVGLDAEYVHNMRVAIRRMRAALRIFSKAFIKDDRARLNVELRYAGNILGDVRDLDVYIAAVPQYLSLIAADAADYRFYLAELTAHRDAARRALIAALDGPRYAAFKERAARFVADPSFSKAQLRLGDVADAGLQRFSSEVFKGGRNIETERDLHALRIAFKRLRYSVEFLRGLAPKRMRRLAKTASRYQDILGRFNDATIACSRVRSAVRDDARDWSQSFLLGYLLACQRLAALNAKADFLRRWRSKGAKRLDQSLDSALAKL